MAWDASDRIRARGPQLQTLNLSKFVLDEPIFDPSNSFSSQQDANMTLGGLLSPIEEESGFAFDNAPLQVKVNVRFLDPVVKSLHYNRIYSSSPAFEPTDRICRGLLHRIEHCSKELITRNDPEALNEELRQAPRFEISFQLRHDGLPGIWAERVFKSYQKHPVTSTLAKDILCSTHSINIPMTHQHLKPSLTGAPDLSCVPRSCFIESTQTWEFIPGYTLELVFRSRNPSRRQALITRTLKVNSKQTAPLNLGQGETLLWQAYRTLEDMLDSRRTAFEIEHADCDGFEGVVDCDCRHFDEDALCVDLRVINNLGPYYEHLHRNIQSRLQLFRHVCGNDCDDFVRGVHGSLDELREKVDAKLDVLNDFDFRIAELIGHGWRINNPARFTLDSKQRHSRRTIEALLDRIRTGVGDVLRGHDVAVRMIAHKRGHLVLDKALISRNHQSSPGPFAPNTPEDEQALFVAHLRARIQADIDLVCKDTCSLKDVPEEPSHEHSPRPRNPPSRPFTPRSTVSDGLAVPKVRRDPVEVNHTSPSYTPPGSPGHFTQPPVPPCVPPRSSSMRIFPLVPAKYREREEHSRNTTPSERDSAIAVDSASDGSIPDEAVSVASSVSGKARPVTDEIHEHSLRSEASPVLSPAAEVFKHSEAEDDDSSSSRSTCSSMPALTESEMATPEHSLLITPSQMRHSSPDSEAHLFNVFGDGGPSSPLVLATPELPYPVYPAAKTSAEHGLSVPKTPVTSTAPALDLARGEVPAAVSTESLASTEATNGTDLSSALEDQACLQEASEGDATPESHGVLQSTSHEEARSGLGIINNSDLAGHTFDESECESSDIAQRNVPQEGWLLHCVEEINERDDAVPQDAEYSGIVATVTECGSSDTLRTQIRILDDVIDQHELPAPQSSLGRDSVNEDAARLQLEDGQESIDPGIVHEDGVSLPELFEAPEAAWSGDSIDASADATQVRDLSAEDEMSRSKMDYFEADEDDTDSEEHDHSRSDGNLQPAAPSPRFVGASETQCITPLSDSEGGISQRSETLERSYGSKHPGLGSIDEAAPEPFPDVSCSVRQHSSSDNTESATISGPSTSDVVRGGDLNGPNAASLESTGGLTVPDLAVSAPKTPKHDVFSEQALAARTPTQGDFTSTSETPRHETSQSLARTKPRPAPTGLKTNFLLPSLPVFASIDPTANQSRASFQSSSSEWEDCVSEARQSSDSVDTIQQPPSLSDHDVGATERPGSPKRLGTPTAGILGLHESRWADFGIRGALTGSHAFDRPSTAPLLSAEHTREEKAEPRGDKVEEDLEETPRARPATPHRKSLHLLHHKKSISSIIFPGTHHGHQLHQHGKAPKLTKKESKELRAREKSKAKPEGKENGKAVGVDAQKREEVGDAGRFPRAMMLITGLAIASSVVNRSSA
ncbi:hypothetical protein INS49_010254 [Diaporthe citri]|uniref:uncharacterized protein n=1 Tax=Diaporthe citri TaxID=83186 RepID=UPI001C805A80|nr:uncharacterized protein INS49_010254 [Diaporthe citri]KAG6362025.1 hypothetical protein INS49_010254 [Diaporthe citri]